MAKVQAINTNTEKYRKFLEGQGRGFQGKDVEAAIQAAKEQFKQGEQGNITVSPTAQPYDTVEAGLTAPPSAAFKPPAQPVQRNDLGIVPNAGAAPAFWNTQEFKDFAKDLIAKQVKTPQLPDERAEALAANAERVAYQPPTAPRPEQQIIHTPKAGLGAVVLPQSVLPESLRSLGGKPVFSPLPTYTLPTNAPAGMRGGGGIPVTSTEAARPTALASGLTPKPVRTPFDLAGQPMLVEQEKQQVYDTIDAQYIGHPTWASIAKLKYDAGQAFGSFIRGMGRPAQAVMEMATGPKPPVLGALIQLAANAIPAGGSFIQHLQAMTLPDNATAQNMLDQAKAWRESADAQVLNGQINPDSDAYRQIIGRAQANESAAEKILKSREIAERNWGMYSKGTQNAWDTLVGAVKGATAHDITYPPMAPSHPLVGQEKIAYEQQMRKYLDYKKSQEQIAASAHSEALDNYLRATNAKSDSAASIYAQAAVDAEAAALDAKFSTDPLSPLNSYTWASEPAKRNGFLRDLAAFQLQMGRDATPKELQDIKDHWVNPWTDGVGQALFDPMWLIPAEAMEIMIGKPLGLVAKGFKKIPGVEPFLNWAGREAYTSISNRLGRSVYDTFSRMRLGYTATDDFIKDVPRISDLALEVDGKLDSQGMAAAIKAYEDGKAGISGLDNVPYDDFRKLTEGFKGSDGAFSIDPTTWKNMFESGRDLAIETRKQQAIRVLLRDGKTPEEAAAIAESRAREFIQDVARSDDYLSYMREKAEQAFLAPHRAFKGSRLVEDTILGKIAKGAATAGKLRRAEDIDRVAGWFATVRNLWTNMVLNVNPSRVIRNLIDSTYRDVVYGGNVLDDLDTLFANTHMLFADDLGFIPVEFGQSLARMGLEFDEGVPARLMFSENKPKFGIFSYWKFEQDRLADKALAANALAGKMSAQSGRLFSRVWNGFKTGMEAIPGAFADYNTAIEFTLRLRMFHREYFNLIRALEPSFMTRNIGELSPEAQRIMKEAWEVSGGNAAKMGSYLDSITLRKDFIDKVHPQWSYSLPEDFAKGMDDGQLFAFSVRANTDNWIDAIYRREGRIPNTAEIDDYIDKSITELETSYSEAISNNWDKRNITGQMFSKEDMAKSPKVEELEGSAPNATGHPTVAEQPAVPTPKAPTDLKAGRRVPPAKAVDNYTEAMNNFATVERISGTKDKFISVVRDDQGVVHIRIPNNALTSKEFNSDLHLKTIKAFSLNEEGYIRAQGMTPEEWRGLTQTFLTDPMKLRNENEKAFTMLVRQMERKPEMYNILVKTGNKVQSYQEAAINLRKFGYLDYLSSIPDNQYFSMLERAEEIAHPRPPEFFLAGDQAKDATGDLGRAILNTPAFNDGQEYINNVGLARSKYEEYRRLVYPGPHAEGVDPAAAGAKWEHSDMLKAAEYQSDAAAKREILGLIQNGKADEAAALLKERNANFTKYFLQQNGFTLDFNEAGTKVIGGTMTEGGKARMLTTPEVKGLNAKFFSGKQVNVDKIMTLDMQGNELSLAKQMQNRLMQTFGMSPKESGVMYRSFATQAELGKRLGRPEAEFWDSLGFKYVNHEWQMLPGTDKELIKKGLLIQDPETGKLVYYGVGTHSWPEFIHQSSLVWYKDWESIAKYNTRIERNLKAVKDALGITGDPTPEQLRKFSDIFMSYIAGGQVSDKRLLVPFESFSKSIVKTYEGMGGEAGLVPIDPGVRSALNQLFMDVKASTPPATAADRMVKALSKLSGSDLTPEQVLEGINLTRAGDPFETLDDVPPDMVEKIIGAAKNQAPAESLIQKEKVAFDMWKKRREFVGFPKGEVTLTSGEKIEPLANTHNLKLYLKDRMMNTTGKLRLEYSRRLWDVEQFQNAVLDFQLPRDLAKQKKEWDAFEKSLGTEYSALTERLSDTATPKEALPAIRRRMGEIDEALRPSKGAELPPVPEGYTRLYRGETSIPTEKGTPIPDWLKESPGYKSTVSATGRWFSASEDEARYYVDKFGAGTPGNVTYIDVPTADLENYRASNNPEVAKFSGKAKSGKEGMAGSEFFVSPELAAQRVSLGIKGPPKVTDADIYGDLVFPHLPESAIDDGVRTWARNNASNLSSLEQARVEMQRLREHLQSGNGFARILPEDLAAEIQGARQTAIKNKSELVSLAMNGGEHNGQQIEGAITKVNRVMLDYNYRTRFDNLARNVVPFWQFPSRSWPFWAQTLATRPEIIAAYQKFQNLSRQTRFQHGAVTSTGKPMPSLDGYVPIPGTDLWFNPLAPLSFTYVLGMQASPDDVLYQAPNEDTPPQSALAQEFLSMSPVYGFSPAPWITWLAKGAFQVSNDTLPPWPLLPQISLVPRWMMTDLIDKANKAFANYNINFNDAGQAIYPEVTWHDYLVERNLLESLNAQLPTMNNIDAQHRANDVALAIKEKGDNPIWLKAYQDYTGGEASRSTSSFLSGIYTKSFTDADVDMLALRNQNNLMKSALNNKFQTALFGLPQNDEEAWNNYLTAQNVPEGWLYRVYSDIGYVRNDMNQVVTDPAERAKLLAQKIQQDENNALYYQKVAALQRDYQQKLTLAGVGAPYEKIKPIIDDYYAQLDAISSLSNYKTGFGTNKPASMIEATLADRWNRMIWQTRPTWDAKGGETYDDWQKKIATWEANLPQIANNPNLMKMFALNPVVSDTLNNLRPDQNLSNGFFNALAEGTNAESLKQWQYGHDSVIDAMNNAWQELYWKPYWDSVKDPTSKSGWKSGAAYELAQQDFLAAHPEPPTPEEMYRYISQTYGTRFSEDQIKYWYNYDGQNNVYDINKRLIEMHDTNWQIKEDIYNLLSAAGPGKGRDLIMRSFSAVENQEIEDFLNSGGTMYDKDALALTTLHDRIKSVVTELQSKGLQAPTRDDMVIFATAEAGQHELQQMVSDQLQMSWEDISKVMNVYYGDQKNFARDYPKQDLNIVLTYNQMRSDYADKNPVWAMVYMWAKTSKYYGSYQNYLAHKNDYKIPTLQMLGGAQPLKPPPSSTTPVTPYTPPGSNTPAGSALPQPVSPTATAAPVQFENVGGLKVPVGFRNAVSNSLFSEVAKHMLKPGIYPISRAGVNALNKIATTHVDWADWIKELLASNP